MKVLNPATDERIDEVEEDGRLDRKTAWVREPREPGGVTVE